ncbi:MAG: helicase-related protein [Vicinamibacterales bacterium]
MLQELHPGLRVAARGDHWRVASITAWTDCTEVRLAGLSASNDAQERLLLAPFDRFEPLDVARGGPFDFAQGRPLDVARVSRRAWMRALARTAAASRPACGLQAAHRATIDLLPWQLEPALALARGAASRVLVADAVGLGKTVQALAALAELDARGEAERVLIVTPAGLRDQWSGELAARFGRTCIVADAAFLAAAARDLPPGVNPWSLPGVYVVSLDFLKRREVLRGIEELWWDLAIADEAHLAAPGTDRGAALDRAAGRAARVILLTATPYASDRDGYDALCAIGQGSPRMTTDRDFIVFRRTRGSLGLDVPARRTRVVQVRLTPAERRLHRLLERYTSRVWRESPSAAARLAMIVLRKRALSSVWAAGRTIERRLALLNQPEDSLGRQASLPFDPDEEGEASADDTVSDSILGAPGLTDNRLEQDALATLAAAAASAAHESKLRALKRILARTRDAAIVFTEYRDTLEHLAKHLTAIRRHAVLHGGLSRDERRAASTALNEGSVTLLLATDAAGEGLNLHYRCRWVINFELPWNPARLEQRAGRVDRYGQRRRPHAMHLVARDTAESVVLARLEARIRRARQAGWLDDVWPAEPTVAAAILGGDGLPIEASARARERAAVPDAIQALAVQACADATAVAPSALWRASPKLQRRRALVRAPGSPAPQLPLLLEVKPSRLARGRNGLDCLLAGGRSLFVYRIDIRNGAGRIVDSTLIGALDHEAGGRHYDDPKGSYYNDERLRGVQAFRNAAVERLLARWRAIAASPIAAARPEVQPALFDRRALDLARTAESARMSRERDLAMRVERLERSRMLTTEPPELLLIARPASTRTDGRP